VRTYWTSRMDRHMLTPKHHLPFYDAAWELCRIGVLRPGGGAAAESILLALAVTKLSDEAKVLSDYASAGGRGRVTKSMWTFTVGRAAFRSRFAGLALLARRCCARCRN
jgi:hypothetical protein